MVSDRFRGISDEDAKDIVKSQIETYHQNRSQAISYFRFLAAIAAVFGVSSLFPILRNASVLETYLPNYAVEVVNKYGVQSELVQTTSVANAFISGIILLIAAFFLFDSARAMWRVLKIQNIGPFQGRNPMSNFPVESCEEVPDLDWRAEVYANERVIKSQNRHMDIAYNNLARTSMLGVLAVLVLILSYINQSDVLGLLDIIIAVFLISRGIAITTHSFILLGSFSLEFWKSYQNQGFKRTKHTLKMFYDRSARTGPHYLIIAFSIMLSLIVFVIATITGIAWWVTVFRAEVTLWLLLDHIPFLSANHLLAVILLILIVFSIFNPQGLVLGEGHQRRRFEL